MNMNVLLAATSFLKKMSRLTISFPQEVCEDTETYPDSLNGSLWGSGRFGFCAKNVTK